MDKKINPVDRKTNYFWRFLSGYRAMTSTGYRLFEYIVVPVFVLMVKPVAFTFLSKEAAFSILMMSALLMLLAELIGDFYTYGGITDWGYSKTEWLKTGRDGIRFIKNGIIIDKIRRFVWIVVAMFIFEPAMILGHSWLLRLTAALILYGMVELNVNVSRMTGALEYVVGTGIMMTIVSSFLILFVAASDNLKVAIYIILVIDLVIAVGTYVGVCQSLKRSLTDSED